MKKITTILASLLIATELCTGAIKIRYRYDRNDISIDLNESFEHYAQLAYPHLQYSPYFDPILLKNIPQLYRKIATESCSLFGIKTIDNTYIHCTFFDRGSNELIVIGPGFPTPQVQMVPFIEIFSRYDVILFDYRGQGCDHNPQWDLNPFRWFGNITHKMFGIDMNVTGLDTIESTDVITVVQTMRQQKSYIRIHGLGLCYSSFIFAQAATQQKDLFDTLIFDACWPSLKSTIKKIVQDPSLICGRHPPSSPVPWITYKEFFKNAMCSLTEWVTNVDLDNVALLSDHLAQLSMPILFFQCLNDCYCSTQDFDMLWDATQSAHKVVVFTTNRHGKNHLWQKEVYAYLCNKFLEDDYKAFIDYLEKNGS